MDDGESNASSAALAAERPTILERLKEAGLEISELGFTRELGFVENGVSFFGINIRSLPTQIVDLIKASPLEGRLDISGQMSLEKSVSRFRALVFNPRSQLTWMLPDVSNSGNFVALAADELIVNVPNRIEDLALLKLRSRVGPGELAGGVGAIGQTGWTSGVDDGTNGLQGGPGQTGGNGRTYEYPSVFIAFNRIKLNFALPNISVALKIEGLGVKAGDGGTGGRGGEGGRGARGTPGSRECPLPGICYCTAGPGRGGHGGAGGPGGKGGDAGRGGAGANLFFVGPQGEYPDLSHFQLSLKGADPGAPGQPGKEGPGGAEGGGGSKPFECAQGGGEGQPGGPPNPRNLGPGSTSFRGFDGTSFFAARDNSDLFIS